MRPADRVWRRGPLSVSGSLRFERGCVCSGWPQPGAKSPNSGPGKMGGTREEWQVRANHLVLRDNGRGYLPPPPGSGRHWTLQRGPRAGLRVQPHPKTPWQPTQSHRMHHQFSSRQLMPLEYTPLVSVYHNTWSSAGPAPTHTRYTKPRSQALGCPRMLVPPSPGQVTSLTTPSSPPAAAATTTCPIL